MESRYTMIPLLLPYCPFFYVRFVPMHRLKKSLGQHFLKDEKIIQKIIDALLEYKFDQLLEVGAGGGALTKELVRIKGVDFKTVELDDDKVKYLANTYKELNGKIIHRDFLEIDKPFEGPFVVIGNFPYNISSQILFRILDWKDDIPVLIGMFQKEVALRAAATPGSKVYGVLSALIQPYYHIEYLFDVPPSSFNPPPKVMSGVIKLTTKKEVFNPRSEKHYRLLVKTAFNQRRKKLRNAVRSLFPPDYLGEKIFDKRAEQLGIEEFTALTYKMN